MSLGYEKAFNNQIRHIINLLEHEFYIVHCDNSFKCTCLQEGTEQANPSCKKCLGTGYKIKIKKAKGAMQMTDIPPTSRKNGGILMNYDYYIEQPSAIKRGDYIVDENKVLLVDEVQKLTSFKYEPVFKKVSCVVKKRDYALFFNNFNQIVGGKKR